MPSTGKFRRASRILTPQRFREVFGHKCSAADAHLVVYVAAGPAAAPRLGLVVGRTLGGAVQRNRIKRRLREAFRLNQAELPRAFDLVVVPRVGSQASRDDFAKSLVSVSRRAVGRWQAKYGA